MSTIYCNQTDTALDVAVKYEINTKKSVQVHKVGVLWYVVLMLPTGINQKEF